MPAPTRTRFSRCWPTPGAAAATSAHSRGGRPGTCWFRGRLCRTPHALHPASPRDGRAIGPGPVSEPAPALEPGPRLQRQLLRSRALRLPLVHSAVLFGTTYLNKEKEKALVFLNRVLCLCLKSQAILFFFVNFENLGSAQHAGS